MRHVLVLLVTVAAALALPGTAGAAVARPPRTPGGVRLVLPEPAGPHRIGTVSVHLVDRSRPDPWVPARSARELMIQLWYPARDVRRSPRAPWVGPALAALLNPPGSGFELPVTHAHTGAPAAGGRRPVVLYSPGFGLERTASTALVEELASHGYIVVTIDHTYDSPLPQTGAAPADLEPALGTIDGGRSVRVQRAYLLAFADRYLGGRGGTLLSGPSAAYPEMRFLP